MKKTVLILFILFPSCLFARTTGEEAGRPTIALLNLQANNCPFAIARGITDMLGGKLFDSGMFILLERGRMDLMLKEQGITGEGCEDTECAAQMGQMLSVQKMLVGSVSKLGDYRIEIRIINVASNTVDLSVSSNAGGERDFERTLDRVVTRIRYFYSGMSGISGDYDMTLSGSFLHPMGDFSRGAANGAGTRLSLSFNEPGGSRMCVIFSTGAYYLSSKLRSVESIYMTPLELLAGYPLRLSDNLKLTPAVGGGYMFSRVRYDRIEERTSGRYRYTTGYFYNPSFTVRTDIGILLGGRFSLSTGPVYTIIFENHRQGHVLSAECGIKMAF